eukprot:scaffold275135_cov15-Tisochrysis_lutea.AAC.1
MESTTPCRAAGPLPVGHPQHAPAQAPQHALHPQRVSLDPVLPACRVAMLWHTRHTRKNWA